MNTIISILLYVVTFTLSALFLKESVKKKKKGVNIYLVLSIALPVLLAAFRHNVGTDYANYVSMYEYNSALSFKQWFVGSRNFDENRFGIWLICRIAGIFGSPKVFFALIALIIYLPVALTIRKFYPKCIFLAAFTYLMTLFSTGLNISKQVMAISVLIYGLQFAYRRKFFRYCLIVLCAMCFHITSVIGIGIYFIYSRNSSKIFNVQRVFLAVCFSLAIILLPQILSLIGGRFAGYIVYEGQSLNRSFFIDCGLFALFVILRKRYIKLNKINNLLIATMLFGLILEYTGFYSPFIKRIASYYMFPQFILLAQLPLLFHGNDRSIVKFGVYFYTLFMFVLTYGILRQADIIPYTLDASLPTWIFYLLIGVVALYVIIKAAIKFYNQSVKNKYGRENMNKPCGGKS
ncbi:MAG: EpsG family protein [Clostridia bacterium]|nr:EpsG family protein [Clostridia bacterium]